MSTASIGVGLDVGSGALLTAAYELRTRYWPCHRSRSKIILDAESRYLRWTIDCWRGRAGWRSDGSPPVDSA